MGGTSFQSKTENNYLLELNIIWARAPQAADERPHQNLRRTVPNQYSRVQPAPPLGPNDPFLGHLEILAPQIPHEQWLAPRLLHVAEHRTPKHMERCLHRQVRKKRPNT